MTFHWLLARQQTSSNFGGTVKKIRILNFVASVCLRCVSLPFPGGEIEQASEHLG